MIGRILVLIVLILALAGGGLVWFDYLNVIDAKDTLAPVYRLLGREARSAASAGGGAPVNLNDERFAMRLEAEALYEQQLEKREADIAAREAEIEQEAEELEAQRKALEEQRNSLTEQGNDADTRNKNVEELAEQLNRMPLQQAVDIIAEMDDQQALDVFRKTEEIARRTGGASMVSTWLGRLDAKRAAELMRKWSASGG